MNKETHVVVLGAGYAGLMVAMRLAKKAKTSANGAQTVITLVNADDTFHERVRNHQFAAGESLRQYALAALLRGTRIQFQQGVVQGVQLSKRQVTVQTQGGSEVIDYDYLMYALGSFIKVDDVPGAREYAYTLDTASAMALAERLPEVASRGGRILVVGGGNTGVEVATELAESYPALKITLITRHSFAHNLSAGARAHVRKAFERFGIQFVENAEITKVSERQAQTAQGEFIPFDICVWAGGFAVSSIARQAGLRVNERGQILIDRAMRSVSHPNVYAVGDASFPMEEPGAPVRMALYTALMMGVHGADCLAAELHGTPPTAFGLAYVALGISLGRRDGVFQFLNWSHDTPLNLFVTGRLGNLMREFFVRFALETIRLQRVAPWAFYMPGSRKMRQVPVDRRYEANRPSAGAAPAARVER